MLLCRETRFRILTGIAFDGILYVFLKRLRFQGKEVLQFIYVFTTSINIFTFF